MSDVIVVNNQFNEIGIRNRVITKGIEFDLVCDFIDYKKKHFRSTETNKMMIFIEPQVNDAYPDVVIAKYNPYNYEYFHKNRFYIENYDYKILYILNALKRLSCEDIVNITGDSWKDVVLSLERLIDSQLVIRKSESWEILDKNKLKVKKLEIVEAKINKLDKVIEQAILNKKITSNSYVLSNVQEKTLIKKIDKFDKMDIGLYASNGNKYKTVRKVSKNKNDLNMYSIMINEWIGRVLNY